MDDAQKAPGASTVLLPVSEAASRLGLTPAGLRSRIRRRLVTFKRGNSGILVEVPADSSPVGQTEIISNSENELQIEVDELRQELTEAKSALARAEERIIAARAEAERDARERMIGELRQLLDDARKPWWQRWLHG